MNQFRASILAAVISVLGASPGLAQAEAGAYLAARAAGSNYDFERAAEFLTVSLRSDPGNPLILENLLAALIGQGEIEAAVRYANQLVDADIDSQLANMVIAATDARTGDWAGIVASVEAGRAVGPLVDGLSVAWAHVGLGQMTEALAAFDAVSETDGLRGFGLYHKALALAVVGDFEGADAILSLSPEEGMQPTRRATVAHLQVLSQLDRNTDAIALIDQAFPDPDPEIEILRGRLEAGEPVPFTFVGEPAHGLAEVYYSVAAALDGETLDEYILHYARVAELLNPANTETLLLSANLLDRLERYDLATATYNRVSRDDPFFHVAELGRAESLRKEGRVETSIEVLEALSKSYPDMPMIFANLGDTLRQLDNMQEANAAYTAALALFDDDNPQQWFLHYTRGITYERLDEWDASEADFRRALELSPGQPQVLNYLGYSLVERQIKLEEALEMIEDAVAAQPDSGAIVDSLGWALYRLERYEEAVGHMERAAELLPVDPVINDHLGDVYWAVGRKLEARFQWTRALSFEPEEEDATRIRRKLEVGLDAVLAEEGAEPIHVAHDTP